MGEEAMPGRLKNKDMKKKNNNNNNKTYTISRHQYTKYFKIGYFSRDDRIIPIIFPSELPLCY